MSSDWNYTEVVRLTGEFRRKLSKNRLSEANPQMVAAAAEYAMRIRQLAPELATFATDISSAARVFFGVDREAAQRSAGGTGALRSTIAGAIKKIDEVAQRKGGEAKRLGEERPPKPQPPEPDHDLDDL